ncbi:STAS/SEC14 domain-containing protein [Fulvivirga ulvae]|uniref:STAS/SEC14 domain-containing protein n=1 Tax=Fulvivirga ulvae TaxID=2904245 RepID=UPI001F43320D|nr:STAS/SEC14 domain-containing protein [Fulvivirga ulvae]UII31401.1 STAS/SEC14 domain-containing protein [Fulvivirga ulvae]
MIEILTSNHDNAVAIRMNGELTTKDYEPVVSLLEDKISKHGKINLYCEVGELEEVEPGAIWKDLKFDARHFNDFERVAMVGDKQWLEWGAKFARPFTSAQVEYFDMSEKARAMQWVVAESNVPH